MINLIETFKPLYLEEKLRAEKWQDLFIKALCFQEVIIIDEKSCYAYKLDKEALEYVPMTAQEINDYLKESK